MSGGIMLDECANRGGEHLAFMELSFALRLVAAQMPGAIDDRVQRNQDALVGKAMA